MANVKISELTALTPPDAADLVPVTDSSASQTKRTTVGEIVGIINGDVEVANDGTATISELPVSKLQDGAARQLLQTDAAGTGVEWTSDVDVPGTLDVTGATTLDAALNVAGLASLDGGIDVDGAFTVANTSGNIATSGTLNVDGEATLASAIVEDLTNNRVLIAGTDGAVEDDANLTFDGTTFDVGSGNLQITAANGNTSIAGTLGVTGQSTLASAAVSDLTSGRVVLAGTSGELQDSAGLTFSGTQLDVDGDVVITGDLTVEGASTILETETVKVEDKNIELGVVASPTDVTADGGGITLKGSTDKTINWVNPTDSWTSSEHVDLASGKSYRINGTEVLSATALGSAVQISSANIPNGTIVDADVNASAEIAVSKLADGSARQLLQTDAAGTGVEWTSNVDIPGTLDVTSTATLDAALNVAGQSTLASAAVSDLTSGRVVLAGASGELQDSAGLTFDGNELAIGGDVDLDASKVYRIAGAEVLSATALGATVVTSSLTSVGTITTGVWQGTAIDAAYLDSTVVTTNDTGTVTSTMLADNTIVDADINTAAAIAGTKISPDFGSQNIATTGDLDIDTGLLKVIASTNSIGLFGATPATQPAAIANITTTATTGSLPTADGSVTIADAAAPTVDELLEYCVELEAKLEAALAALRTVGVIAT